MTTIVIKTGINKDTINMKQIKLFIRSLYVISLLAIGFAVASCTNELWGSDDDVQVFKMKLNIGMQQFDGIGSRAASSFPDGASLLMRFDSEAYGTAVYDKTADNWNVSLKGSLKNTSSGSCDLYYSPNKKPSSTYTLSLDHSIPLYSAKGVYSYSETGPVITATLKPAVPRVCFKGTSGKKISLSGLSCYQSVDVTKSTALSTGSSDISLTVNGTSTDYVYGFFAGSSRELTLTVDDISYTRTIESSMLANGQSGYIDIPTASNLGKWKKVNTDVLVSEIELSETEWTMKTGETLNLSATVKPSNATNKTITWSSSNSMVATVSDSGTVTAKSTGTVIITAKANDASGISACCSFTVKDRSYEHTYEYVDLGLSVKWAAYNVGAKKPEDSGIYYAWGETRNYDKKEYSWETLAYCSGSSQYGPFTKYVTDSYGNKDGKRTLEESDDAARQQWGGKWRMPTKEELDELGRKCNWTRMTQNNVKGYLVISKYNGNSIFIPCAGYYDGKELKFYGSVGDYWSSTLSNSNWCNYFDITTHSVSGTYRYKGLPVRAVFK